MCVYQVAEGFEGFKQCAINYSQVFHPAYVEVVDTMFRRVM